MRQFLAKLNINLPPLPPAPPTHSPDRAILIQMAVVIAIAILLHFSIASLTIALFSTLVFAFKCIIIWRNGKPPSQWLVMLLTLTSVGLIVVSYGGWNGQTAGISFLTLLVSLKFLESQTVRDYFIVCLILYFLTASSFLFNSSLTNIGLVVLYTVAVTGLLFKITNPATTSTVSTLKSSSALILKALPLALFLFFFFPRVHGSFGFLPSLDKDTNALDDSLVAGEMASSAFSDELSFRVKFDGDIPPTSSLYWRAKVMTNEVDFTWEVSKSNSLENGNQVIGQQMREQSEAGPPGDVRYDIVHEPTADKFLPYLDYVRTYDKGILSSDHSVRARPSQRGSFSYSGTSTLAPSFEVPDPALAPLIATQSRPTARTQALLNKINQDYSSDVDRVNAVYGYFRDYNNQFRYSLEPPVLDEQARLDDFLFNTRTGYCEHYASAFTTLLRWLKIPARVVVGYHGGNINRIGNLVEVRYSDAHAWSEAYLNGEWVRYDPTGAVSPDRIEYGIEALRERYGNGFLGSNTSGQGLTNFLNPSSSAQAWRRVIETWSSVQYQWKKWVIDYDFETQQELLKKIGLSTKNGLTSLLLVLGGGVFVFLTIYFWQLLPKPKKHTELQRIYYLFIRKARKGGLNTNISDTPNEVAKNLAALYPHLQSQIYDITRNYNRLCYGAKTEHHNADLDTLKRNIRHLKLKRTTTNHQYEEVAQ